MRGRLVVGGLGLLMVGALAAGAAPASGQGGPPPVSGLAPTPGADSDGEATGSPAPPAEGTPPPSAGPETVIGADGRTQVTGDALANYPSRAIGKVLAVFDGTTVACTGFLIDSDFILTAAHCGFFDPPGGDTTWEFPSSFTFTPGQNGLTAPWGTCTGEFIYTTQKWRQDHTPQQDFAGVQLAHTGDCARIGDELGTLGILAYADRDHFNGDPASVRGYPVDKPVGTMWTMKDRVERSQRQMLFYDLDTGEGQSGGPLYVYTNPPGASLPAGFYAIGIHAYGTVLDFRPCFCNAAARITVPRVGLIGDWIAGN